MELSLELSIGGCYKNREKNDQETENTFQESENIYGNENNSSRSDASESNYMGGCLQEDTDPQRKRELQAMRRREAIKKREEKQKRSAKSKPINGGSSINGFSIEKGILEMQQHHAKLRDRDKRENENGEENRKGARKSSNLCSNHVGSLQCGLQFWENKERSLFQPVASRCFRVFQGGNGSGDLSHISAMGCDSERGIQRVVASNGSLERTSSAFSDYQSTSQKGGSCSTDTAVHSNYSQGCQQQLSASATSGTLERSEANCSSGQMETDGKTANFIVRLGSSNIPVPERTCSQKSDLVNSSKTPQELTSSSKGRNEFAVTKPHKPQNHDQGAAALPQMPFVSATGNGPNGKTVNGFLYRYTKSEVSIVCVCHGSSFSPAEFVEHAGGVDVSHPLRHITIVPTSFG